MVEILTIGIITYDTTLLFQIINLIILLLIVIGIPVIILKIIKMNRIRNNELQKLNEKIDSISEELNNKAE